MNEIIFDPIQAQRFLCTQAEKLDALLMPALNENLSDCLGQATFDLLLPFYVRSFKEGWERKSSSAD